MNSTSLEDKNEECQHTELSNDELKEIEKEVRSQQEGQKESSSSGGKTKKMSISVSFPLNCRKRYKLGVNQ